MEYTITIFYDSEADVYIAINNAIGLILEDENIEVLKERVKAAIPELLTLNKVSIKKPITFSFNYKGEL